ncbi:MAG: alanine--tRNA ligase [Planctomycetota bacterium]|nr:alanine--tRNA ligase [Planctomycetota bacterium]
MTSDQIRQEFIDFFVAKHGHTFVPSSPVVPLDDPTLLFTNAGMNQFKPIFLGQEKRAYTRAANTQKCIRAGGKHNDLDDVGRSRRHHTFFEMLGNWSFGDYFKRGAIEMAWELLTKAWKIDPSRLHVTCYEGNEAAGIPRDLEAANLWKEISGLPDDHIHFFGKDNFWEMGDTGPCGPCTEIYVDRTPEKNGGKSVNGDDPRVMEIWNLVFIQYNRDATGKLTPLPAQHVDTGMGFERICQVLQGKDDNYATDLWTPLFDAIRDLSGKQYTGLFTRTNAADPQAEAANQQLRYDIAFRVVADHIRCLTFAVTDGAVPSNEGRGYVLRRILRRAVRFGRQQLGLTEPFLHRLVEVVVQSMGSAFPELRKAPARVIEIIKNEEVSFSKTLDRGIQLFEEASDAGSISAPDAFKLHDTYGFPIDLTRIMAEERGMRVDVAGYEKLMEQAKELARSGGKEHGSKVAAGLSPDALAKLAQIGAAPTDDQPKFKHELIEAKVLAIWNGTDLGLSPASVFEDEELAIILDRSNFYAEMGGQVGDSGELRAGGSVFDVESTRSVGGYVLHIGRLRSGKIKVGDRVQATVTAGRARTEKNHTGTHLANWALREVLGEGVQQKGSLVDPEKLRFDFSHAKSLGDEEIARVEELVRAGIAKNLPVYAEVAPQEAALKIHGLRAVFGEKYPPMIRIVSIGAPVKDLLADPGNPKWRQYSVEFCGGTHLGNSSEIAGFVVMAEESVSKGIRRIVGFTGEAAAEVMAAGKEVENLLSRSQPGQTADQDLPTLIVGLQKSIGGQISLRTKRRGQSALAELQSRYKTYEKASRNQSAGGGVDAVGAAAGLLASAADVGGGKLVVGEIAGANDDQLRSAVDSLRKKSTSYAILLGAASAGKVTFVGAVSDDLIAKGLKAGDWVKQTAAVTGGGGGGRPQMAQGSGKDPAKMADAIETARKIATEALR